MIPKFPVTPEGGQIDPGELRRLQEEALREGQISPSGPLSLDFGSGGPKLRPLEDPWLYVKITRGTNPYSWTQQYATTTGGFSDLSPGLSGSAAYTMNGTTDGSTVITGIADTTGLTPGQPISGTNIAAGTKIVTIDSATQITVDTATTGSGTNAITFAACNAAYELNDHTGVPAGTYVILERAFVNATNAGQEWAFHYADPALIWNVVAVTLAAGTYNNYALTAATGTLLITTTGAVTITGFAAGANGRVVKVELTKASTNPVTLPHQSGSSLASNQVYNPNSWDEVINPGGSRVIQYNTTDSRWLIAIKAENPAYAVAGEPTTASVTGNLAVNTNGNCAALYVNIGGTWYHTAGGGLKAITADTTAVELDYTKLVKLKSGAAGLKTYDLPNTGIGDCWHVPIYNEPATSDANSATLRLTIATVLFGTIFHGGGGYIQADGAGSFYAWGVEQYRYPTNISTTTYTLLPSNENRLMVCTNAAGCAISVPQASNTTSFPTGFRVHIRNSTGKVVTLTPTTSTINGLAVYSILPRRTIELVGDGANWFTEQGKPGYGVTDTTATINEDGQNNGKVIALTGSGSLTVNEGTALAGLPPGDRFAVSNYGTGAASLITVEIPGGTKDAIPPRQGMEYFAPDNDDAGSTVRVNPGMMVGGKRSISGSDSTTRADSFKMIVYTGTGGHTLTLYTLINATWNTDHVHAEAIRNLGTEYLTVARGGTNTIDGQTSIRIYPCQGVWAFADAADNWHTLPGKPCFEQGTAVPSHTEYGGTPYFKTDSKELYVNNSGIGVAGTTWDTVGVPNISGCISDNGGQAILVNANDQLTFDTEEWDAPGGMVTISANSITIVTAGIYEVWSHGRGSWNGNPADIYDIGVTLDKNAVTILAETANPSCQSTIASWSFYTQVNLAVNDVLKVYLINRRSAGVTTLTFTINGARNVFGARYVGPTP